MVVPTHRSSHTLDLIITPKDASIIGDIKIQPELPSDHFATTCSINIARPAPRTQRVKVRRFRSIDITQFKQDIASSPLITEPETDINLLTVQYDTVLRDLMDKHAPIKVCKQVL